MWWFFVFLLKLVGLLAAVFLFALWYLQNKFVYPSFNKNEERPEMCGLRRDDVEDVYFKTRDNVTIHGLFVKALPLSGDPDDDDGSVNVGVPTLLFFHGNAGNVTFRLHNIYGLTRCVRCNVFIIDYRGYGRSGGESTEAGLRIDGEDALRYLRTERTDIDRSKIVVFGRSLGGAVALHVAMTMPDEIAGLILENTFISIPEMIPALVPALKYLRFFSANKWNSLKLVKEKELKVPTLFCAAIKDEMVPHKHMLELYAAAIEKNPDLSITMYKYENGGHMSLYLQPTYYLNLKTWLKEVLGCNLE